MQDWSDFASAVSSFRLRLRRAVFRYLNRCAKPPLAKGVFGLTPNSLLAALLILECNGSPCPSFDGCSCSCLPAAVAPL